MTLNQLRYFQAVCRYNSITKAAGVLMVSQPSISNAIKGLEAELGVPLLLRSNNRLSLTCEGKMFYEVVSQMLDQLDTTIKQLRRLDQKTDKVTILLGVPPVAGSAILPEVIRRVYAAYPNMAIETFEAHYCRAQQMVLDEIIDCTLTVGSGTRYQGLEYLPLSQLKICYCVSTNNPLAALERVSFEQIKDLPAVLFKSTSYHYGLITQWFEDHGCKPNVVMQSDRPYEIMNYLVDFPKAGAFMAMESAVWHRNIIPLYLEGSPYVGVAMAYKKDKVMQKSVRQFLQLFA